MPEVNMHACGETTFFVHFCNAQLWNDAPLLFKGDGRYGKMLQDDRERAYPRSAIGPGEPVLDILFDSGYSRPKAVANNNGITCSVESSDLGQAMEAVASYFGIIAPLPQLTP